MASSSFTAMVFQAGGSGVLASQKGTRQGAQCFGGSEAVSGRAIVEELVRYRISEGTLGSFLVRFGDFFVLHCHGVSGWRVRRFGGSEGVS